MSLKEKQSFIKSNLSKDIELIKNLYSTVGYSSSEVEAKIKEVDERSVELILEIERAIKLKFHQLNLLEIKKLGTEDYAI